MMEPVVFSVKVSSGEEVKGHYWAAEKPIANLNIQTGMCETSIRYAPFAEFLNQHGINVWVLDAFGQGLNAPTVDDLQKWPKDGFSKNVEAIHLMNELAKQNGLPLTTMGHSMGSFMTQSLLQRYPHYTDKVIICGSNGGQGFLMKMGYLMAKIKVNEKNWDKESPMLQNLSIGAYEKSVKDRKTDCDWLSYNEENVQTYIADPYCGHKNTGGFWKEFLRGMSTLWDKKNLKKMSKDENILIVAGQDDAVGQNGRGPKWLEKTYKGLGIEKVSLRLYKHMRHEILCETDKQQVFDDLCAFILS